MPDVICPGCNERYHETLDNYRDDIPPNGSMFRLKSKYVENGWAGFIEDESTIEDNLCCPDCNTAYIEQGRVRLDVPEESKPGMVPCPECGELFKASGLHFHMKAKHG